MHYRTAKSRYLVVVVAAVGLICGAVFASSTATGEGEPTPPGPARGHDWALNSQGESYGSLADARTPAEEPDLIFVASDDGQFGYVKKDELDGPVPRTPEEAAKYTARTRTIPVYKSDGSTRIGWFTIGDNAIENGGAP